MVRFLPLIVVLVLIGSVISFSQQTPTTTSELNSAEYISQIYNSEQISTNKTGIWRNKQVTVPNDKLSMLFKNIPNVLGQSTEEKWIEVDLSAQKLYAHEGTRTVYEFPISSGMPWTPTVTGEFRIWAKVMSQRMKGGNVDDGSFYDLPNVPFIQYFHNGYGIHGAYWHNDFGKPRSHGCVNMKPDDSKTLFYWTDPQIDPVKRAIYKIDPQNSIRVSIHGTTPKPY